MLLIKNCRALLPSGDTKPTDILCADGKIKKIAENISCPEAETVEASGLAAAPGLVDMHVHLREPGFEYKEDIASGCRAAAAGGVTRMCPMPNTRPVVDSPELLRSCIEKAEAAGTCGIFPIAAVTVGQAGGELCDYRALKDAGAVAFSDDGLPVMNAEIMRRALTACRELDMLIISHSEDENMVGNYAVNEGEISKKLGIPGRPAVAEDIMVARDALLAADTGARVHIAHVSTAGSVEIIRRAKAAGVRISCETCPQYFLLTEQEILKCGSMARVNPPLRTEKDRLAIIQGLKDGVIDAIVTDHAPHSAEEKSKPLAEAPSGISGLETSLALTLTSLYHSGLFSLAEIIRLMSENPARLLGLEHEGLKEGAAADIVLFDPDREWVVEPQKFFSRGKNTPLAGRTLKGRVLCTIKAGRLVYSLS